VTARERLMAMLRMPPPPVAPDGDESVRVFRAAPNYFRYRVMAWLATQAGAGLSLLVGLLWVLGGGTDLPSSADGPFGLPVSGVRLLIIAGEIVAVTAYVVQFIVSAALLRLDFEQRWYMVSDRSLRIREGLLKVEEKTMTFANVQQMTIQQNPVQRWLGIADLQVRTAGGGGKATQEQHAKQDLHVGYFRGLADAAQIRDAIRDRMRRHADAGLGDPDDREEADARPEIVSGAPPATAARAGSAELAAVAALLRDETRALRQSLSN
jgi:membrane protein YdbS with pleckstrin-like domain